MSILIKGMKMPEKCDSCDLFHAESPMHCTAVKGHKTVGAPYGMPRPDWCPLVEIPEHGRLIDADALLKKTINNPLHVPYITKKDVIDMLSALNNQVNLCDSCTYTYPECPSEKDDVIFGNGIGNDNICACNKYQPTVQPVATDTNVGATISKFIDGLEEIFADLRERHVDDSVCGLCEYDGAYMGQSGDWCNECPGFNRDDCFKLSDEIRKKWTDEIIKALPTIQPEPQEGHWIGKYPTTHICSECGWLIPDSKVKVFAYCPNCGAKMKGEPNG